MQHMRLLISSGGLLLGCAILGISLSAGNTMVQSAGSSFESSKKQLYMDDTILPDHLAYPVLMAVDRAKLEMETPEERVYTQVEYARRRFESTEALLEKGNTHLALTTITKAEKYLLDAAHGAINLEHGNSQRRFVLRTIEYYNGYLENIKKEFPDADRPLIDHLKEELDALQPQLEMVR